MAAVKSSRSFERLKNRLREQLQAKGLAGARLHGPAGELPFEEPLAEWKRGDPGTVRDLGRATVQLVEEVPANGWTPETLEWLAGFIEDAPVLEAMDALETVVHRKKWLTTVEGDGNRAHMLALRTLRGMSWKADPSFWLGLPDKFKKQYPALVFGGLADHNLDLAFENLPTLAADTNAAREICGLFASLVETEGSDTVWGKLDTVRLRLQPDVAALFEKWFEVRNYPRPSRAATAVCQQGGQQDQGWIPSSHSGDIRRALALSSQPSAKESIPVVESFDFTLETAFVSSYVGVPA